MIQDAFSGMPGRLIAPYGQEQSSVLILVVSHFALLWPPSSHPPPLDINANAPRDPV